MAVGQGLTYSVDLVLVIDATGSMSPIIDDVKTSALSFYDDLQKHMAGIGKNIDDLRVRVIAFRDYYADSAADSLVVSDFLELPDQRGLQPPTLHHFYGSQTFAPAAALCFGKIDERASFRRQHLEAFE